MEEHTRLVTAVIPEEIQNNPTPSTSAAEDSTPISPHEDPDLVGVEAAAQARQRRLYMAKCRTESEALASEARSWNFMTIQMTDWEDRQRSWNRFESNYLKKKKGFRRWLR